MPKVASLFAATTAIAAIVAVSLWLQLHRERQLAARQRERGMQLELALAPKPRAATAPIPSTSIPSVQDGAPTTTRRSQVTPAGQRMLLQSIESQQDAQSREARLAQLRLHIPRAFPDLAQELDLTSEQASALLDLLAEQQLEAMVPVPAGGTEEARQEAVRARREAALRQQDALESRLGREKYGKYREYQQALPARRQVADVQAALAATMSPLTEDQRTSLVASLASEQKRANEEALFRSRADPTPRARQEQLQEGLKATEEAYRRVLESAQYYLNPQQLAVLRGSMEQRTRMTRAASLGPGGQPDAAGR